MTGSWQHFRIDESPVQWTQVWIDVVGKSVNVLAEPVFNELVQIVEDLENSSMGKPVVFRSAKPKGFIAGADLQRVSALQTFEETQAFVDAGQTALRALENASFVTVALIEGACLGGGLEFALACRWRVAVARDTTQLGLPESKLGLMPGWGGTQRLVERIGVFHGAPMLLDGYSVDAQRACQIGLVDAVFEPKDPDTQLRTFIARLPHGQIPSPEPVPPPKREGKGTRNNDRHHDDLESDLRHSWQEYLEQLDSRDWTRAQSVIANALHAGLQGSRTDGFLIERNSFFELLCSKEARSSIAKYCGPRESPTR